MLGVSIHVLLFSILMYMNCFLLGLQLAQCSALCVSFIVLLAFIQLHPIAHHSVVVMSVYKHSVLTHELHTLSVY